MREKTLQAELTFRAGVWQAGMALRTVPKFYLARTFHPRLVAAAMSRLLGIGSENRRPCVGLLLLR